MPRTLLLITLSMLCLLPLTGCITAMFGAAGAASGYFMGKEDRGPQALSEDVAITTVINTRYSRDPYVSMWDVRIHTVHGVVTLSGVVPNPQAADHAISIAQTTEGVRQVISQLTVGRAY